MNDKAGRQGPFDREIASAVARRALAWRPPLDEGLRTEVEADFVDATRRAEQLVSEVTGLRASHGHTRAVTVDRAEWVDVNLASFDRLLAPLASNENGRTSPFAKALARTPVGRQTAGVEIGLLLSWMSSRVLGQYDILPGSAEGRDAIYYVAPNIVGVERRYGFAPRDFRLWIAVHEVTHRMQFTGVEWMEAYFVDLVERASSFSLDASAVLDSLSRLMSMLRAGESPIRENGVIGLLASKEQLVTVREAQALMSLLEGHADVVMSAVGDEVIPGASRFAKVLSERRENVKGAAKIVQQLLGIEAKLRQYREGEEFVNAVIDAEGMAGFSEVWRARENLPTIGEIRDPGAWLTRVHGGVAAAS